MSMEERLQAEVTRRDFLKATSAVGLAAGLGLATRDVRGKEPEPTTSSSDKIRVGFIGVGPRGSHLMNEFLEQSDVLVTAVCDVYEPRIEEAIKRAGVQAKGYRDFRKLLDESDCDVIVVATPPHWHALISICAMQAGKDVYCEKPMCLYPDEAVAVASAAKKYQRVTQLGTQIHAMNNYRRVVEIVRSGVLGKIMNVRTAVTLNESPGRFKGVEDSDPPKGLDWDLWLGPGPNKPFNKTLFEDGGHRYFKEFVMSWVNELGPHIMDLAFWAMNPGAPSAALAAGGRFVMEDVTDIPDTVDILYEYPGFSMNFIHTAGNGYNFGFGASPDRGRRLGVFFHGTNGTLAADYSNYSIFLEGIKQEDFSPPEETIPASPGHVREFLDGVKTRVQPLCNFEYHFPMTLAIALGHVALFSGERVEWDAKRQRVVGSRKARQMAQSHYRKPWSLPRV
ncbi:MAG TPA: Gfo/Idh/MocA family oxidoreductase [bacterium]|nr:Gfo/Idh/MocA family oxidoreductase [bacterium]